MPVVCLETNNRPDWNIKPMTEATETAVLHVAILEESIRSSRFRGGEPIVLADGQAWYFPRPNILVRPTFTSGDVSGLATRTDLGDEFRIAMDDLENYDSDSGQPFVQILFRVATAMLRFNYRITDDQLSELLEYQSSDDNSMDLWKTVIATARGEISLKNEPGGDTSGSP